MKRLIFVLAIFALRCSNPETELEFEPFTGSIPESMKGYEMYSWQEKGVWNFTLITGTNRLKTHLEITAVGDTVENGFVKVTVKGVPAVKDLLNHVPAQEYVTWISDPDMVAGFSMPSSGIVADIQAHCDALNLHLQLAE